MQLDSFAVGVPDESKPASEVARERFVANGVTIPVLNFMNVEEPAKRGEESWQMLRAMAPR